MPLQFAVLGIYWCYWVVLKSTVDTALRKITVLCFSGVEDDFSY